MKSKTKSILIWICLGIMTVVKKYQRSIAIAIVLTLGFAAISWAYRQKIQPHAENVTYTDSTRYYRILIPERYGNAFFNIISGNENQVSVADYKTVIVIINNQIIPQSQTFYKEDSVRQSKLKKDTTNKNPNKP